MAKRDADECLIYGLRDPRTGEIRYVGKSRSGLRRPMAHRDAARLGETCHKANWIRGLLAAGFDYEIVILERPDADALDDAERRWIAIGRMALGDRLTNATTGGDGGFRMSRDSIERMSKSKTGKRHTSETKARMAAAHRGRRATAESRLRMSAAQRGHYQPPHTAAARAMIGSASKGRKPSQETRQKLSRALLGKHVSDETRAKLAAIVTPEECARRWAKRRANARARADGAP